MILHCSRKLAAKLAPVSAAPLKDSSPLGSWHGHLFVVDRRQCVMFCHDATRFVLFMHGWRKERFEELRTRWFFVIFGAVLANMGCSEAQVDRALAAVGEIHFDTATDRSVQGSINIAVRDLWCVVNDVPHVLELDPVATSCRLNERPATVYGKCLYPDRDMLALVARL